MIRMLALVVALGAASVVGAQGAPTAKARGTITAVSDDALTVAIRESGTAQVRLGPKTRIAVVTRASRDDLKPDAFIGVAAAPDADGGMKALEVHVFSEAMRGTGEGTRPFDLAPHSTMTNGALAPRVGAVVGDKLTVNYAGGSKTFRLPADAPIVAISPGARSDLKVGAGVVAIGAGGENGAIDAAFVIVGKDGVKPPM